MNKLFGRYYASRSQNNYIGGATVKSSLFGVTCACAIVVGFLIPSTICAAIILDQSFVPSPAAAYQGNIIYRPLDSLYVDQAQTFTVGVTGQLTNIEVLIEGFSQTADLLVDIRPTINGIPISDDSAILGEVAIPASEIPGFPHTFINVDYSSQNIHVTSGSELALVLKIDRSSQGGDYSWRGDTGDLYTSGVAYTRTSTTDWLAPMSGGLTVDYGFKTFVNPIPIPPAIYLFGTGLIGLIGISRRK